MVCWAAKKSSLIKIQFKYSGIDSYKVRRLFSKSWGYFWGVFISGFFGWASIILWINVFFFVGSLAPWMYARNVSVVCSRDYARYGMVDTELLRTDTRLAYPRGRRTNTNENKRYRAAKCGPSPPRHLRCPSARRCRLLYPGSCLHPCGMPCLRMHGSDSVQKHLTFPMMPACA